MTGKDSVPAALMEPAYDAERGAMQAAVNAAVEEDTKGTVSMDAIKRINGAVAKLREKFRKNVTPFTSGSDDALQYLSTMASLSRLLNDPSMKRFLEEFRNNEDRTVGDLISFMDAYNLRFGPASSSRQLDIYTRLVPILTDIRDSAKGAGCTPTPPDRTGEGLRQAAKDAFKSMKWEDLESHARDQ
jgi:hypothetical protein